MDRYGFTKPAARQIQKTVRKSERSGQITTTALPKFTQTSCYIAKSGAGGIAARSGTTPGSGTVDVWTINAEGTLVAVTDSSGTALTLTAYNLSRGAVSASAYIMLKQDVYGRYLVDFEDCGE